MFTGPEYGFGLGGAYKVLSRGSKDNAFVSTMSSIAGKGGIHLVTIRVEEFAEGRLKPFWVADGGTIVSGLCE